MNLPEKFHTKSNSQKQAQDFMKGKETLDLSGKDIICFFFSFFLFPSIYTRHWFVLEEFISYCSLLVHPLLLEFHFKRAISSLNGKVDVHYGPLPALHSECQEFVLVSENVGDEKASSQKEHESERSSEYDDCCHEYEDDDAYESECGNVDKDEEDESVSGKQNNENGVVVTNEPVRGANKNEQVISCRAVPGIPQSKHEKAVGVWKPKAPVSPMYKN
ncbi:hypothetical protein RFI_24977 [Reticulomyxa filosa]|uniref:Uncharacterized protein n=1 Tax=Reticulomyxa filosa TaxID=46433 RepID=X6MEV9_RETFI|nr:hypothetical protein RFI_24977 [Reticulomyxa filosa]|eukprot:ETO12399.1 hypothetical protein RFI_24977 [Reticulomyxa filosa]